MQPTSPQSDSTTPPVASRAEPRVAAIVVAAGRGSRFGASENKVLLPLAGEPIWVHSVRAMQSSARVHHVVLVVRDEDRPAMQSWADKLGVVMITGGEERSDSVRSGLRWIAQHAGDANLIAVHDAARPLVTPHDVASVIEAAWQDRAAILATPVRGTIKRATRQNLAAGASEIQPPAIQQTVDRSDLWEALTPQVFDAQLLQSAYQRHRGRPVTDDAEIVERAGTRVRLVPGSADNLKLTRGEDLQIAQAILNQRTTS